MVLMNEEMDKTPAETKSRACTECKKHKVKCEQRSGQSSCTRCRKHGFRCISSSRLERIIDDDTDWKKAANANIIQLQAAVADILHQNQMPELYSYSTTEARQTQYFRRDVTEVATRENSPEPGNEPDLVSAPMRSLFEVTKLKNIRSDLSSHPNSSIDDDLISRGAISLNTAKELFSLFDRSMNHFLWGGIALVHRDLLSVRQSSNLLSTAILTVAALHLPNGEQLFDTCYNEFVNLVSRSLLNRDHNLDDIRGLCIAAFWMSDLSWKLSGLAVRIATELNLHQSFQKLQRGEYDQFEGAQLWYLLYVCDHHFSIAYGRPPVIHDSQTIKSYETFLEFPAAGPSDLRVIAQVALFVTLTSIYHTFGSDSKSPLQENDFITLRAFGVEIENWRIKWQPRLAPNPYVGSYPSKGVVLHYHFSKLQLNSLALRGISPGPLSLDRREAANVAISSAMATLNLVLYEPDIRKALVGVPLFKHTMITFSAVFLLKVSWNWSSLLNVDKRQVLDMVQAVIDLFTDAKASNKHLTYHIAKGLGRMLRRLKSKNRPRRDGDTYLQHIEDNSLMYDPIPDNFGFEEDWMFPTSLDFLPFPT